MGMAFFTFGSMFSPLQILMGLRRRPRHAEAAQSHTLRPAVAKGPCEKARKPLRVVRVVDTGGGASSAGRMFMSGRMADVCAELDRLAALEAAAMPVRQALAPAR